jgi:hypothetical protein
MFSSVLAIGSRRMKYAYTYHTTYHVDTGPSTEYSMHVQSLYSRNPGSMYLCVLISYYVHTRSGACAFRSSPPFSPALGFVFFLLARYRQ